nr:hypothetical protein [Tanacetum cinerariifolium]
MVDTRTDNGGVLTGSNNVESQLTSMITDITHLADHMIALVNKLNGDDGTSQKKGNLMNQNGQNSCNGSDSGSLMGHVNDDDVSLGKGIRRNREIGNGKIDALKVLDEIILKPKMLYDAYCVAILQESTNEFLRKSGSKNVDSNTLVLDVSDCLDSDGIEIVNTIEKNDGKQDIGNDIEEEEVLELNDASGEIDISIGLMSIRLMDCDNKVCYNAGKGNDLKSNESSEVELNWVVRVDKPMKVEDENKSVMSVDGFFGCDGKNDKFVHFDGKREDLKSLDENREEDCNMEETKSNGVTDIVDDFGEKVLGEICKEYVKVKGIQSKNSKGDDGNKKCLQNYDDIVKGGKLMDNGQVICRNRGMLKVAWKPLVKMRMNGSIMGENSGDVDYVVINESVVGKSISEVKLVFKSSTWSLLEEHDINNFKRIWEDSKKMIILLTHVVSYVKWGLLESKGKDLNNLMSCKDANKNGVNSCYWELSGYKWHGRKKTCGIFCQVKNNKWKFDIWRWPKRKKNVC